MQKPILPCPGRTKHEYGKCVPYVRVKCCTYPSKLVFHLEQGEDVKPAKAGSSTAPPHDTINWKATALSRGTKLTVKITVIGNGARTCQGPSTEGVERNHKMN